MTNTTIIATQRKLPKKLEHIRYMLDRDDDGVYVSAAIHPQGETAAFFCASFDGVSILQYKGHPYLPIDWIISENKADKEVLDTLYNMKRIAAEDS